MSAISRAYWADWREEMQPRDNAIANELRAGKPQKVVAWHYGMSVSNVSRLAVRHDLARRSDAGVQRTAA